MKNKEKGLGLIEVLIIVAILLLIAAIAIPQFKLREVELTGYVRNANLLYGSKTVIAFEKEDNITPLPIEISGYHPEFWKGEHVHLLLKCSSVGSCSLVKMERLGPDKP